MLKTPEHGWSEITIGDWSDRCSYLNDVPYDLYRTLERACRESSPYCVQFNAEGWEYILVFDLYETHIISNKDDGVFKLHTVDVKLSDLAKEFISDVRRDVEAWSRWGWGEMTEEEVEERRKDLPIMCDILEKRI